MTPIWGVASLGVTWIPSRPWEEQVGRLGLRLLAGEKPETIPPSAAASAAIYVDWRQLQRWGLDESRLPPGSIVRFKEPSLWEAYKWQIAAAIALIIGQAILISALLLQARRRRRAELAARDSEERMNLATTSANLGLWHWDSASNRLWASEICRRIVGLGPKAEMALETFLGLVHREDLAPRPRICCGRVRRRAGQGRASIGSSGWIGTLDPRDRSHQIRRFRTTGTDDWRAHRRHPGKSGGTGIDAFAPGVDASHPCRHPRRAIRRHGP